MTDEIITPKYRKGKKPTRTRKPSRPLDGINHRLLREKAQEASKLASGSPAKPGDDAAPTRSEMEIKARELGIKFDGRTGDKSLLAKIEAALAVA